MAQLQRPISTITDQGSFTGPSAHGSVDGTAPDTGDYWTGNDNEDDILEVLLTDLSSSTPGSGTCTVSIYEAEADTDVAPASGGTTPTFDIEVYEGATQRAVTTGLNATESTFTLNNSLTFAADDITDWSDVRVRFTSHGTGGNPGNRRAVAVSYIDISVPDEAGTLFFQTVTGAVTPTGATEKQTSKTFVGSVTPTGATVKETLKVLAGAFTPAGALVRETLKSLAGALTPSGTLDAVRIILQAIAGALAPSGALVKQTQKAVAGTVTPAGTLVRETLKVLSASLAPVGSLVKETGKILAGALTPTGALTAVVIFIKNIAGSLTPSGGITKQTQKNVAGSVNPTGATVKQTAKIVSGEVTPSGALDPRLIFRQIVSGVLNISGAVGSVFIPGGAVSRIYRRLVSGISTLARRERR